MFVDDIIHCVGPFSRAMGALPVYHSTLRQRMGGKFGGHYSAEVRKWQLASGGLDSAYSASGCSVATPTAPVAHWVGSGGVTSRAPSAQSLRFGSPFFLAALGAGFSPDCLRPQPSVRHRPACESSLHERFPSQPRRRGPLGSRHLKRLCRCLGLRSSKPNLVVIRGPHSSFCWLVFLPSSGRI